MQQKLRWKQVLSLNRFVIVLIFFGAALLRTIYPGNYPFGFDQVQIAQNAEQITQLDLALLGPRTGPAALFTGPLIYYVAAPFHLLFSEPYGVIATAICISLLTGLVILWLSRRYLDRTQSLAFFFLWAFSPLVVVFDRVPWNPNFTFLASALVFLPLLSKRIGKIELGLLCAGVFLGYQAHFTGLFLLPLAVISLFILEKNILKNIVRATILFAAFVISLAPTIIFDATHGWLNLRGVTSLLERQSLASESSWYGERLLQTGFIIVETLGKVLVAQAPAVLYLVVGIALLGSFLIFVKARTPVVKLVLFWLGFVFLAFPFYTEQTPEYYFFILLPVFLFITTESLITLSKKKLLFLGVLFVVYVGASLLPQFANRNGLAAGTQQATVAGIQQLEQPITALKYDIEPIAAVGLDYLVSQTPPVLSSEGNVLHIQYPYRSNLLVTKRISPEVALWLDTRNYETSEYVITDTFMISFPKEYQVYQSYDSNDLENAALAYGIFHNSEKVGLIRMYDIAGDDSEFLQAYEPQKTIAQDTPNNWYPTPTRNSFVRKNYAWGVTLQNLKQESLQTKLQLVFEGEL